MRKIFIPFVVVAGLTIFGASLVNRPTVKDLLMQKDILMQKFSSKKVDAAFTPVTCPVADRKFDDRHYQGPMIDTHIHVAPLPDGPPNETFGENDQPVMGKNVTITDYVCMMDHEGTSKAFGFFAVWDPITKQSLDLVKKTMELYPDRFVPFIMPPGQDDRPDGFPTVDAKELSEMLAVYPRLFFGYGEIGLYARGDNGGPKGAPALPPDSKRMKEIYPVVRNNNLLVYVHLGEGQKKSFERTLEENPDINFIFHGDQLIQYGNYGKYHLSEIDDILNKYSNAYYGVDELYGGEWILRPEVSKEEFIAHFDNPEPLLREDVKTWKAFIERHPDQVLWGTDRGWSSGWSVDPEAALVLNTYTRMFIDRLDPAVQEKYAYKNAEKLIARVK